MTPQAGPLYEFTFLVEPDFAAEFDRWLEELVEKAARTEGVANARIFAVSGAAKGAATRVCQLQCVDDNAIDDLLDGLVRDTDTVVAQQFGETVSVSGRMLREDNVVDLPPVENPNCLNCSTRLKGQYCGNCGQRARTRLISLWQLISEAFGDLLEFDSRLWRTLIPLLARPGQLTRDYLEGRRARYMPPFRTYLVLSVIFFVVAFFDPRDDLSLLYEPEPVPPPEDIAEKEAQAADAKQEILDELAAEGVIVGAEIADELAKEGVFVGAVRSDEHADEMEAQTEESPGEDDARVNITFDEEENRGFNVNVDDDTGECDINGGDLSELPEWFKKRFTPERLKRVCERVSADKGKVFGGLLLDNIPVALIVLLPLMGLVLKILYPLSRRYFVEHLLFFVHYHAFFFLILTLQILFARITALLHVPEAIAVLAIVAAAFYIPVYLFLAMRRVYGQGRIVTFIKYVALLISYSIGAALTMLGAVLFALDSV